MQGDQLVGCLGSLGSLERAKTIKFKIIIVYVLHLPAFSTHTAGAYLGGGGGGCFGCSSTP